MEFKKKRKAPAVCETGPADLEPATHSDSDRLLIDSCDPAVILDAYNYNDNDALCPTLVVDGDRV